MKVSYVIKVIHSAIEKEKIVEFDSLYDALESTKRCVKQILIQRSKLRDTYSMHIIHIYKEKQENRETTNSYIGRIVVPHRGPIEDTENLL